MCGSVCVHIRSTGADCFDVISPALMNTLICLTTSLSWRGEGKEKHHQGCGDSLQSLTFAYGLHVVFMQGYMYSTRVPSFFCLCGEQPANQKEARRFIKSTCG